MSQKNVSHCRPLLGYALVLPLAGLLICCSQSRNVVEPVPPVNQPSLTVQFRADGQPKVEPLYILDGVEQPKGGVSKIDPNSIESISVLKGTSATSPPYGEKGKNGIILITSRKK